MMYKLRDKEKKNKIKEARRAAGITPRQMAEVFKIPLRTLVDWETEKRKPTEWAELLILEKLEKIKNNG